MGDPLEATVARLNRPAPAPTAVLDPLLAALIGKLPASGSVWPVDKRAAWMRLVWNAFELNYEAGAGESLELPDFLSAQASAPAPVTRGDVVTQSQPAATVPAPYAFYIDPQGYARRGNNDRVMPGHVTDTIYDLRGEGDLGAIIWADDTRGVRGLQLDVSPA